MSVEVRSRLYEFTGLTKMPVASVDLTMDELGKMRRGKPSARSQKTKNTLERFVPKASGATRGWFYNPLHDMESVLWLLARQLLFQDHYLHWVPDDKDPQAPAEPPGDNIVLQTTETAEDRTRRIMAYFIFGHSLFVSRTGRLGFVRDPRCLPNQLDHHHLHPVVHWLGGVLTKMRDDLADEYIKHEADPTKIDHLCAEELHVKFSRVLGAAYMDFGDVENGRFEVMTRSLQAEMEMLREQAKMAAKAAAPSEVSSGATSSKRSRDESADEEAEELITHPSKSPRTETNQSPRRSPIEAATPPQPLPLPASPISSAIPVPPIDHIIPSVLPKVHPKRKVLAVPPATRTLRSHARKEVKLESVPQPRSPSPPPAPARTRKTIPTATRKAKATKNNEAVRAAARVAEKIKTRNRKGR